MSRCPWPSINFWLLPECLILCAAFNLAADAMWRSHLSDACRGSCFPEPLRACCRQLEDKHLTVQTSDHSKVFQFQVRENPKGRFLRVFENGSGCGSA